MVDLAGLGALGLVATEWLALGWLSGLRWPGSGDPFWAARWALRLLVGCFVVAAVQLVLAFVGIGFGSVPTVLAASALAAGALRLANRGRSAINSGEDPDLAAPVAHGAQLTSADAQPLPTAGWPHARAWPRACAAAEPSNAISSNAISSRERLGWLLLAALLGAATLRSLFVPEAGWDAYSHWGLRAQAYALAGTMVNAGSEHDYYPPLVPLLEAFLYAHRGTVALDLAKTLWALVGSAFALCLAWHLHLSLRPAWRAPLLASAIVLGTPAFLEGFWTGQADLPLTAFLTLATLAVLQWQCSNDRGWLLHAAIFGAATAFTKFEGLPRLGVVITALLVESALARTSKPVLPALVLAASAGLGALLWVAFAATHGIPANLEHLGQFQPTALGAVLVSLLAVLGGVRTGGGLLVAALAWAVARQHLPRLLVLVVLGQLAATLIAFLLSDTAPEVEVRTSATRLIEQFLPLALFAAAVGLAQYLDTYNRPRR